jgi:hypothetical protein
VRRLQTPDADRKQGDFYVNSHIRKFVTQQIHTNGFYGSFWGFGVSPAVYLKPMSFIRIPSLQGMK